jgi:hypothetical protein
MFFDYFNEFYLKQGFGATYIITELCWCFAIAIMFNFQSGAKKVIITTFLDAAIVWIAQILLNCSITYFCSLAGNTSINPYLKFIVWLVIPLLHTFYPTDIKKYALRLTYGLAVCVFILFGACISGSVGSAITNAFHVPTNVWSDWTMYIVICLVITTIVILKKFPVSKYKYIRNIPTFAIDGILFLSYSIYFFYFVYSFGKDSSHFDFILPIILYLTCILAYVSYYFNIKDYNNIIDNQAKEMNAESAKKQLQIFTYKYDELHMIRHDIANQFGTFEELLKEKKYDELEQYCQSFSQKVNIALDFIDCGNDALSAILNM